MPCKSPTESRSVSRLTPSFSVSPQLAVEDIAGIAASGFCAIVNNRPDDEAPDQPASATIEAEAKRLGLAYAHIPVVPGQIEGEQASALARFLAAVSGPVVAFCRTGTRSASLWALGQAGHLTVDEIMQTADRAGYDLSSLRPRLEGRAT